MIWTLFGLRIFERVRSLQVGVCAERCCAMLPPAGRVQPGLAKERHSKADAEKPGKTEDVDTHIVAGILSEEEYSVWLPQLTGKRAMAFQAGAMISTVSWKERESFNLTRVHALAGRGPAEHRISSRSG